MRDLADDDHPARTAGDPAGCRRADLLPLLAVVELRPRPGDHRQRRPDDGDDDVSGDDRAFGLGVSGDPATSGATTSRPTAISGVRRTRRTTRARRAAAGGARRCSRSFPSGRRSRPRRVGRLGRGPQARRPLRAGHRLHRPIEAGHDARVPRDADGAAATSERDVARDPRRDADEDGDAGERAVRDRVLPWRRGRRRASASARPTIGSTRKATDPLAEVAYPIAEDQTGPLRGRRPETTSRSTSTTSSRGPSACPDGSSTASARWRSRAGRCSRRQEVGDPVACDASRCASRRRSFPATP